MIVLDTHIMALQIIFTSLRLFQVQIQLPKQAKTRSIVTGTFTKYI